MTRPGRSPWACEIWQRGFVTFPRRVLSAALTSPSFDTRPPPPRPLFGTLPLVIGRWVIHKSMWTCPHYCLPPLLSQFLFPSSFPLILSPVLQAILPSLSSIIPGRRSPCLLPSLVPSLGLRRLLSSSGGRPGPPMCVRRGGGILLWGPPFWGIGRLGALRPGLGVRRGRRVLLLCRYGGAIPFVDQMNGKNYRRLWHCWNLVIIACWS